MPGAITNLCTYLNYRGTVSEWKLGTPSPGWFISVFSQFPSDLKSR